MLDRVRQEIIAQITNIGIDAKTFQAKVNKKKKKKKIQLNKLMISSTVATLFERSNLL